MWPFSSKKKPLRVPVILVDEISIVWNKEFDGWEFSDGEYDYLLAHNPQFDVTVLDYLDTAKRWLTDLEREIETEIKKNLEGWCEWNGEKHVVDIDLSQLMSDKQIDVSYADGEAWGDLGVNIVITNGKITHSYAGD